MPRPPLQSAKLPVQKALASRIAAALAAADVECAVTTDPQPRQRYPYLEVGDDDERERRMGTGLTGSDLDHSLRIRARSSVEAKRIAALLIKDLMDHSNPMVLDATHYLIGTDLGQNSLSTERRPNGRSTYTATVRLEFHIGQH